jgi:hypothetical protein
MGDTCADALITNGDYLQNQKRVNSMMRSPVNEAGMIVEIADMIMRYDGHSERTQFAVTCLGKQSMILGYNWLCNHNPEINWQTKDVKMSRCPT